MVEYTLSIVTPNGRIFEGPIDSLVAPGSEGSLGVWAHHTAMVVSLKKGLLEITHNAQKISFLISSGILEVDGENHVLILADEALSCENN